MYEVLTAAKRKMAAFWVVVPCRLVDTALLMDKVCISETSVNFY
jgi:hypothetical protein